MQEELKKVLSYVSENSPYYQTVFQEHKLSVDDLIKDYTKLPFTTKDNLAAFNDEFLCVSKSQIADYVTTSGTLSKPVSFYLTKKDTERLAKNEAQSLALAGANSADVFQLMVTMDQCFMAGLAYYLGIQELGGATVRIGPGTIYNQIESIFNFNSTVLIAIPSFIIKLIGYAKEKGIDLNTSKVQRIICIGEPIRSNDFQYNELAKQIKAEWDVNLYSTYASTEMGAAFTECEIGNGGHLNPDLLHLEVVDDNGEAVKNNEIGEVVVSTLGVEGMPLLRYKTGDLCHVHYDVCACGSNTPRLGPIIGRKQQMIKYKGTTLFPSAIFNILTEESCSNYHIKVRKNNFNNDDLTIYLPNTTDSDRVIHLQKILRSRLRVTPNIELVGAAEINKMVFLPHIRKPQFITFD